MKHLGNTRRGLIAAVFGGAVLLAPVTAQEAREDAGFLEGLIEGALGGAGRTVTVIGLEGALSSQATIRRIEIADADGTWLTVRDVALNWRRLALLRRRLEVEALTVGTIDLARPPLPGPDAPPALAADPEAQPFSLPELPVSVDVAQLAVGALRLGAPVIGEEVLMSINGAASLRGGTGNVALSAVRIDGHDSAYRLRAGYDNASTETLVDLDLREAAGGLISTLAQIPGAPPLTLTVAGDAPLGDFVADLAFATDGVERLAGSIEIADLAVPEGGAAERMITVDVAGDVAPLFLPDYQAFFGRRIALAARARQGSALGVDVEALSLRTRGLQLDGRLTLNTAFLPVDADLDARLGTDSGLPVVLPIGGPATLVHGAALNIVYDEAAGDSFSVDLDADGVMRADGLLVDRISARIAGAADKTAPTEIAGVVADLAADVSGLSFTDPALWDAAGDAVALTGRIDWTSGGALRLTGVDLSAGDVTAQGAATVVGLESGAITVDAQMTAAAADLARFAAISGQAGLAGALSADIDADVDVVSGAFDVALTGQGRDLRIGTPEADGLLAGNVDLDLAAARDATGIRLDRLSLDGRRVTVAGRAAIAPDGFPRLVDLTGRIGAATGAPVVLPVPGAAVTLQSAGFDAAYDAETGDDFRVALDVNALEQGDLLRIGRARLTADGMLSRDAAGIAGIGGLTAAIAAEVSDAAARDPELAAALGPGARLSGDLAYDAVAGTARLDRLSLQSGAARLAGQARADGLDGSGITASGELDLATGPMARFAALAGLPLSGTATATGSFGYAVETGFFDVDLAADARNVAIGTPQVDQILRGASRLRLRARNDERGLRIDEAVIDTAELNLAAAGRQDGNVTRIDVDGRLRNLGLFVEGFPGAVTLDGDVTGSGGIWGIDAALAGPAGITARIAGDVLRPDGTLGLTAQGGLPLQAANPFIRPRTLEGEARFDLALDGQPGLEAVSGTVTIAGARAADPATRLALEQIGLTVALARGRADLDLSGTLSSGGQITASGPVTLSGNFPADIQAQLTNLTLVDPALYEISLGGQVGVNGPLLGGAAITGRIDVGRSEIRIPAGLSSAGTLLEIRHVGESEASRITRRRAGLLSDPQPDGRDRSGGPAFPLDIVISAPNQIFVRGRGLNIELGGAIEIGGTTANPIPSGGLELIRGRLDLLARQLEFETAEITLQGDLEPDIRLVATSENDSITARIVIAGSVSAPEISFESDPELPEDEVLAQLFFNKSISELTPLEVAQLAASIRQLTGGGGGPLGFARDALGVDRLALSTDEEGNTEVTAGRYITDEIYTDVTVGSDGRSTIELNYEVGRGFELEGGFDNEGNSSLGFSFARDY